MTTKLKGPLTDSVEVATAVARTFHVSDSPKLCVIGSFDTGVTVFRQQVRALNLAWSLIESRILPTDIDAACAKVAIVGAGFAGLTLTAALLRKIAKCEITLFEQRDTLLPLQQGSDSRWLHPHIYDWPEEGSEADVAMLPVLNWRAARASDVVVQVLQDWRRASQDAMNVRLFCNTRHLQITPSPDNLSRGRIEWVGERRNHVDGTTFDTDGAAQGLSDTFDLIVLAVGFGVEDGNPSYWRNETLGQPKLDKPRQIHLVSGQGDGAMIDLLRIRVSQYRQDRILEEMFAGKQELLGELRQARADLVTGKLDYGLFDRFEEIFAVDPPREDVAAVLRHLGRRLRRDTDAMLRLKVRNLSQLLEPAISRISFQNALLVYLLYRCGGFAPTDADEKDLMTRFSLSEAHIVRRHGTKRAHQLDAILTPSLLELIAKAQSEDVNFCRQEAELIWPGGYFGFPGRSADAQFIPDLERGDWRKEYLPGPTRLFATALCGAVAGVIADMRPLSAHFRVTLHRVLSLHQEELLQQACEYVGRGWAPGESTAARTFPSRNATIGLAYMARRPVQSRRHVSKDRLQRAMAVLNLHDAARDNPEVAYLLALPILQPASEYFHPSPVAAVLYVDSRDDGFHLAADELARLRNVVEAAIREINELGGSGIPGVRSIPMRDITDAEPKPYAPQAEIADAIELLDASAAPSTGKPFVLNMEYSDPASVPTG